MDDESLKHLMERSAQLRKELEFIEAAIAARFPHLAASAHPMQQQQEMQQQSQAPVNTPAASPPPSSPEISDSPSKEK